MLSIINICVCFISIKPQICQDLGSCNRLRIKRPKLKLSLSSRGEGEICFLGVRGRTYCEGDAISKTSQHPMVSIFSRRNLM